MTAPALTRPNTINAAQAEANKLAEQKYQARVAELIKATEVRPALTTKAEADNLRRNSQTAEGALNTLESRVADRLAWLSARDGFPTETPLDDARFKAAESFFAMHGEKTTAPQKQEPTAKPAPTPQATNPATLEIEYISANGFTHKLTLTAPTGPAVLESARVAEERLLKFGAKPRTAQAPQASPASSGAGETPMCAVHHVPMVQKSKDGRSWWSCNQKLTGEQAALIGKNAGDWCQYRPPKK